MLPESERSAEAKDHLNDPGRFGGAVAAVVAAQRREAGMLLVNNPGSWSHVYPPLEHAAGNGWTPADLVFPFSSSSSGSPPRSRWADCSMEGSGLGYSSERS